MRSIAWYFNVETAVVISGRAVRAFRHAPGRIELNAATMGQSIWCVVNGGIVAVHVTRRGYGDVSDEVGDVAEMELPGACN